MVVVDVAEHSGEQSPLVAMASLLATWRVELGDVITTQITASEHRLGQKISGLGKEVHALSARVAGVEGTLSAFDTDALRSAAGATDKVDRHQTMLDAFETWKAEHARADAEDHEAIKARLSELEKARAVDVERQRLRQEERAAEAKARAERHAAEVKAAEEKGKGSTRQAVLWGSAVFTAVTLVGLVIKLLISGWG